MPAQYGTDADLENRMKNFVMVVRQVDASYRVRRRRT
jgi:hypothetical protein